MSGVSKVSFGSGVFCELPATEIIISKTSPVIFLSIKLFKYLWLQKSM